VAPIQLSIVIPVYNNWWLTARCLRELQSLNQRCGVEFETIVVDNASTDETPSSILAFPWVRYLRHEQNRNFAGACNAGARSAEAPITLLLNNDAYPLGDALTPLVAAFDRREVAIAGGALFFEDGVTQCAGLVLLANAHWHYSCRNLPSTLEAVTAPRDALAVSGAAMAVRTQWFVEGGGFDESFINGFEDVDLCMRAREENRSIAYVPAARFAHYEAASEGRFAREAENERRFYRRWSPRLGTIPRTARGRVGAIAVRCPSDEDPLTAAARHDLERALRAFGHPLVYGDIPFWRRFDRRFRDGATLSWQCEPVSPGVSIRAGRLHTRGAIELEVPWLPCASPQRLESLRVSAADHATSVGVVGSDRDVRSFCSGERPYRAVPITAGTLFGSEDVSVACAVHLGRSDAASFGNVLLAQAGIPAIAIDSAELRELFASDVAAFCREDGIDESVATVLSDPVMRLRNGKLLAADARRRFSPRRSAIRVVDLLCTARFGLERPASAASNAPL
jgi:GT2 family glycosyltransferase